MIGQGDQAVRLDDGMIVGQWMIMIRRTAATGFILLPPFGSSILEPDLDPGFRQSNPHSQLLSCKDVWVVCSGECLLQLFQLE